MLGMEEPRILGPGRDWLSKTRSCPRVSYRTKFGRSSSNRTGVSRGGGSKKFGDAFRHLSYSANFGDSGSNCASIINVDPRVN